MTPEQKAYKEYGKALERMNASKKELIKIDTIKDYVRHEEKIKYLIFEKKVDSIKFEEQNIFSELFYTNMMRENFKEITNDFKNMVKKLTKTKKTRIPKC